MEPFITTVSGDISLLRALRHSLTFWLELAGVPAEKQASIVLATHEAAANAIQHGDAGGSVTVTAESEAEGGCVVVVRNDGGWKQESVREGRGKGLALMRELMSDVGIKTTTTVRMRAAV